MIRTNIIQCVVFNLLLMSLTLSTSWAVDIKGTPTHDNLKGTATDDDITGHNGDDIIDGLQGSDEIQGHQGNDLLNGSNGNIVVDRKLSTNSYIYFHPKR